MTKPLFFRSSFLTTCALSLGLAVGCSAGGGSGADSGDDSDKGGDGDGVDVDADGLDDDGIVIDPNDMKGGTSNDPRIQNGVKVREEVCDTMGNCTCLRLAMLGTLASGATDKDTSVFTSWLNDNSGGSAVVETISTKPNMDAAWLAQYDILVVANVNSWTFSDAEKAAVVAWSEGGGGIISLTGFESTAAEVVASSQLISFSGLTYTGAGNADWTAPEGTSQGVPVYYQGGTTDLKSCLAWSGGGEAAITAPIKFTPQTGTLESLTFALDYVGAFIGWGVDTSGAAGATVVATDPVTGKTMAAAAEVNGKGRVLAYGDEWVIFGNQWQPTGNPNNMQKDEYNPCYVPATGDAPEFFHSVQTLYQTKQFWYNAINWVAPPNECNFVVEDDDVVVK